MPIAYVNGQYLPLEQATISPMDRGFLFGDGVYEVIPVFGNKTFREKEHLRRLNKSLQAIHIELPIDILSEIIQGLLARSPSNSEQAIYLQITRGSATFRDHHIPVDIAPTIFAFCAAIPHHTKNQSISGVSIITVEDIRWHRCDIKSINLLPNVLMKRKAEEMDAYEAIFVREGFALEGTASNFFMVKEGVLYTPPLGRWLLGGVTRELVLELAKQEGIPHQERNILESELSSADEIWITSSTKEILPIIRVNNKIIAEGKPGSLWQQMLNYYQAYKRKLST